MTDTEKTYKELAKKHQLPDYAKLNHEFEISLIEKNNFLLREIIHMMIERIEFHTSLINSLLHPEGSQLAPLHECKFFDDPEKEKLYLLYMALMLNHRTALLTLLSREEKGEAAFIAGFFKEWMMLKPKLIAMATKIQKSWEHATTIKEELGYFG